MRTRTLLGLALAAALLTAGCAGGGAGSTTDTGAALEVRAATPGDHEHVEGMDMSSAGGPSSAASMICTSEIGQAVARTFALDNTPASTQNWSKVDRLYTCSYQLAGGSLELSVQDAADDASGLAYFDGIRRRAPGASELRGMENFGFPAFATADRVVFLKDGKTLQVDAAGVPGEALREGYTPQDAAYAVASAVIACWTE